MKKPGEHIQPSLGSGWDALSPPEYPDRHWIPESALGSPDRKVNSEGVVFLTWKGPSATGLAKASSEYCPRGLSSLSGSYPDLASMSYSVEMGQGDTSENSNFRGSSPDKVCVHLGKRFSCHLPFPPVYSNKCQLLLPFGLQSSIMMYLFVLSDVRYREFG